VVEHVIHQGTDWNSFLWRKTLCPLSHVSTNC